jgi:hypothetical protein
VHCGTDIAFLGEENIAVYSSSSWAERGFCKTCGSHMFYRSKQTMHHFMPAGLFEDQTHFVFERQSYIDKKPTYYSFANSTADMTEAEMLEKYGQV